MVTHPGHQGRPAARKGDATRRRVIELAAPVLNTKGYAGTAMSDLMAATGLEKGGIYRHFPGKEQLAVAALRHTLAEAGRAMFDSIDPAADGLEQLRAFVANFAAGRSTVAGGCPVLNASVEHDDDGVPALRREARRTASGWIARLAEMVRRGQRSGTVDRRVDADAVAVTVLSTLEGAVALQRLAPGTRARERTRAFLCSYLETLRPRSAPVTSAAAATARPAAPSRGCSPVPPAGRTTSSRACRTATRRG